MTSETSRVVLPARRTHHPVARPGRARGLRVTTLALALVAAVTTPASAHDQLVSTDPADGSTLDHAPAAVTLVFSEKVLDISTTVVVTGPAGDVPTTVAVDDGSVTATLTGDQPNGPYTVTWRVVSSDGHPVQGTFGYALAAPEPAPTTTATVEPTTEPSAEPTVEPTPTPVPTATPEPSTTPTPDVSAPTSGTEDTSTGSRTVVPLVVALAALAAVLGAGGVWARRLASRRTR